MDSKLLITLPVESPAAQPDSRAARTEMTLEERYADDPVLLRFYTIKLPQAGWAGLKDKVERSFSAATNKALGRGQRGKPFQPKTPAPSQHTVALDPDLSKVEDVHVPVAAAR